MCSTTLIFDSAIAVRKSNKRHDVYSELATNEMNRMLHSAETHEQNQSQVAMFANTKRTTYGYGPVYVPKELLRWVPSQSKHYGSRSPSRKRIGCDARRSTAMSSKKKSKKVGDYIVTETLGEGTFGKYVVRAVCLLNLMGRGIRQGQVRQECQDRRKSRDENHRARESRTAQNASADLA
jgi:hypothetical protein